MFLEEYKDKLSYKEIRAYTKKILTEGPFKILHKAKRDQIKILINLKNNHKIYANILAYDKHFNLILINAIEIYKRKNKGKETTHKKLGNIFLRGDNVVLIVLIN